MLFFTKLRIANWRQLAPIGANLQSFAIGAIGANLAPIGAN